MNDRQADVELELLNEHKTLEDAFKLLLDKANAASELIRRLRDEKQLLADQLRDEKQLLEDQVRDEKQSHADQLRDEKQLHADQLRDERQVLADQARELQETITALRSEILEKDQELKRLRIERVQLLNANGNDTFTLEEKEILKSKVRDFIAKINSYL